MTPGRMLFFGWFYLVLAGFFVALAWWVNSVLAAWIDLGCAALYIWLSRRMFNQHRSLYEEEAS